MNTNNNRLKNSSDFELFCIIEFILLSLFIFRHQNTIHHYSRFRCDVGWRKVYLAISFFLQQSLSASGSKNAGRKSNKLNRLPVQLRREEVARHNNLRYLSTKVTVKGTEISLSLSDKQFYFMNFSTAFVVVFKYEGSFNFNYKNIRVCYL